MYFGAGHEKAAPRKAKPGQSPKDDGVCVCVPVYMCVPVCACVCVWLGHIYIHITYVSLFSQVIKKQPVDTKEAG